MKPFNRQVLAEEGKRALASVVGAFLYALGVNMFVVPAGIYTGGLMGICQVIRTLLVDYAHLLPGDFDFAGILYYLINLPVLVVAWRAIDRRFVVRTLFSVTILTVCLSLIPTRDLMGKDVLTACLVGGVITGIGIGLILWSGSTSGGMDVVGVMISKKRRNVSIGRINLMLNLVLYGCCLVLFDVQTAIYSIVYSVVASFAMDKLHAQNINEEVIVITKAPTEEMTKEIMKTLTRGVTRIDARGSYTDEPVSMLYIVVSKFEIHRLRTILRRYDPQAFVTVKEHTDVYGNYLQKL